MSTLGSCSFKIQRRNRQVAASLLTSQEMIKSGDVTSTFVSTFRKNPPECRQLSTEARRGQLRTNKIQL